MGKVDKKLALLNPQEKLEMLKAMYIDIFFFADVLFGDSENSMHYHCRSKSPDFHKEIVQNLLKLDIGAKIAIVAPRDHAKSTLINLIYPLHRILFGEERFILLISESEMQSKYNLESIGNEIEHNPKIKYFFGNRMGETWGKEEKEFIGAFENDGFTPKIKTKVLVRGTGQKVRGLKYGAYRPTLTIIDDGEGEANTATPVLRDKFRRWINAAVIPGSGDAKLIFIGTIVDEESYLNRIAGPKAYDRKGNYKVKAWKSLFYQAIIQDTKDGMFVSSGKEILDKKGKPKVLWDDRRPYKWLNAERDRLKSEGDVAYFYQEYQNIPMDDSFRVFKKEHIQYWEGRYLRQDNYNFIVSSGEQIPVNIFMGVDPASSENIKADFTVALVVAVDDKYNVYVIDMFRGQVSPMDGVTAIIALADKYHPKDIRVEKTGHVMLTDYLMRLGKETGRFLPITPKDAIKSKFFRIKEMQPLFASKAMFIKDEHYELESELLAFREHGTFTKDTLDALRWATEDVYPNHLRRREKGGWETSIPQILKTDWETGEIISA